MPVEPLYLRRPDALTTAGAGCVVSLVDRPTLREVHWSDIPALAALERDLFAARRVVRADLVGRARRPAAP